MVKKIPVGTVKKIRREGRELQRELRRKTATYAAAALALVTALAWNEAIKSVVEFLFPLSQNSMTAKLIYALLMTVILVLVTVYVLREEKSK